MCLEEKFKEDEKFRLLKVDAVGGRVLDQNVMKKICDHAKSFSNYHQIHFILMGGNNIRSGWETVDAFVSKCQQLAASFENVAHAKIVFVGMIPTPKTDCVSKKLFVEANKKLQQLFA